MSQTAVETSVEDAETLQALLTQFVVAWQANDAKALGDLFAEDGTLVLPGDLYLKSRAEISGYMARAYQGPYKGTGVFGTPVNIRLIGGDTAVLITEGGVLAPGETEVAPKRQIRATWVCVKQGGEWRVFAYHNSPVNLPN